MCDYAPPVDRLVQAFKFGRQVGLARPIALAMAQRAASLRSATAGLLVVAVPLAPGRLAERGFDHAGLLARRIAATLDLPVDATLLRRIREQAPQAGRARDDRLAALAGAFACRRAPLGRRVVLVDDVMTTGATCDAAARALLDAGAVSVAALVLARTRPSRADPRPAVRAGARAAAGLPGAPAPVDTRFRTPTDSGR